MSKIEKKKRIKTPFNLKTILNKTSVSFFEEKSVPFVL